MAVIRIVDGERRLIYHTDGPGTKVFIRVESNVNATTLVEEQKMHKLALDIKLAVEKALDQGFDVEIVRMPVPPLAMGRNQVHLRIWQKPRPEVFRDEDPVFFDPLEHT